MAEPARQEPHLEAAPTVDEDRLQKASAYIEEEEGAASHFGGWLAHGPRGI